MGGENSGLIIFLKKKGFYLSWTITHIKYFQCVWDFLCTLLSFLLGFPGGTSGKEPACQCRRHETRVSSLGGEDPLEEGMATHFSILAWRIPWTEEPGGLQSMGLLGHNWSNLAHTASFLLGTAWPRERKTHQMEWIKKYIKWNGNHHSPHQQMLYLCIWYPCSVLEFIKIYTSANSRYRHDYFTPYSWYLVQKLLKLIR